MYALATTTVSILRGTTRNYAGDEVDGFDVHQSGIIAALIEKPATTWDDATQQRRTVRRISCTLPSDTQILGSDRILDERTGHVYSINQLTAPASVGMTPDLELTLLRVTSVTT